jgi:hypothetical protein
VTTSKIRFETVLACWFTVIGLAWTASAMQDQPGQQKEDPPRPEAKAKEEKASKPDPEAPARVALNFKISVEGLALLPVDSAAELKGLDSCDAVATAHVAADGQGKFPTVPPCKVQLKIFITGMNTGIVQVDMGKHKESPIQIQMKSSGEATVTNP